jgi:hypothetical protein
MQKSVTTIDKTTHPRDGGQISSKETKRRRQDAYNVSELFVKSSGSGDNIQSDNIVVRRGDDYLVQNINFALFFRLKRNPFLLSQVLQELDTGAFVLRDKMNLEFRVTNNFACSISILLLYVNCREEIVSVYPKALRHISSKEDFEVIPPKGIRYISINSNQLFELINQCTFQFILVAVDNRDEQESLRKMIERIKLVKYALDAHVRNSFCYNGVFMINFVFVKL